MEEIEKEKKEKKEWEEQRGKPKPKKKKRKGRASPRISEVWGHDENFQKPKCSEESLKKKKHKGSYYNLKNWGYDIEVRNQMAQKTHYHSQ